MPVEKFFPNDHRAATTLAIRSYKPQKSFGGDIIVFKAAERPWYVRWDRMEGWQDYAAGKVTFHEIPGTHGSVVREPNVKYLADAIFAALPADDEK